MMMYCLDEHINYPEFVSGHLPRLLFVCKTEGEESAIPRVMHKHNERMELMYIARGSGDYSIGDRVYLARQGDIMVFNEGVVHEERPHLSPDSLIYSCGIKGLRLAGLPDNHLIDNLQDAVVSSAEQDTSLKMLFETLAIQCYQKKSNYSAIAQSLLNAITILCRNLFMTQERQMGTPEMSLGLRVKRFIDEHYMNNISLETMTDEMGMNRFYLSHSFKAYTGHSPKQYLIRRRIGEAQSLLLSSDHSVSDISGMVGYENVHNFRS